VQFLTSLALVFMEHPTYYWSQENATFEVFFFFLEEKTETEKHQGEKTVFRIPQHELVRMSSFLKATTDTPAGTHVVTWIESAESFERILKVVYPRLTEDATHEFEAFGVEDWVDVVDSADALGMPLVRKFAMRKLDKIRDDANFSAVKKYKLGQQYPSVLEEWKKVGLVELCAREQFMTEEEAKELTTVEVLRYAAVRVKLEKEGLISGCTSTSTAHDIVCTEFKIETPKN
jgi:hypothetical protein